MWECTVCISHFSLLSPRPRVKGCLNAPHALTRQQKTALPPSLTQLIHHFQKFSENFRPYLRLGPMLGQVTLIPKTVSSDRDSDSFNLLIKNLYHIIKPPSTKSCGNGIFISMTQVRHGACKHWKRIKKTGNERTWLYFYTYLLQIIISK